MPLVRFLSLLLSDRLVPYTWPARNGHASRTVWTTPQCANEARARDEERRRAQELVERAAEQERREREEAQARADRLETARLQAEGRERAAAADPSRAALARHSRRLPGIEEAMAGLRRERGTDVTVGRSVGDSRYSGGVPLVDAESGTLLPIFDPLPRSGRCPGFLLDVGLPLLLPTEERRERFEDFRAAGERLRQATAAALTDVEGPAGYGTGRA
ncbi:hypothetical protein ACH4F6_34025 [Streptomyces sp. NPDC017936]|uniref:hypothetical protein n=1 Tax=Streptomyces sp. NPDC017936 TaxID=3365016 RepID=UPI00379C1F3D